MSLRPLPSGTTHILSPDGMQFLPVFVQARLDYLASCLEWFPSEDETADGVETVFAYHEVRGALSDGHYSVDFTKHLSPINFWIASDDDCKRSLYIGGNCWICKD